jgi:hypothetical protein
MFVQLDAGGNVVTLFGCAQHDPLPAGYAEVADDDPRIAAFEARQAVPKVVTKPWAKVALLRAGLLDTVEAYVAAQTGDAGRELQIWWADATEFERANPKLNAVAAALGLSDAQVDDLFAETIA